MKSTAWSSYKTYLRNGEGLYMLLAKLGMKKSDPDDVFLCHAYKARFGKELDLEHPKTFNEKLLWLKLHDRNPLYTLLVDKCEVKKQVAGLVGDECIIPTLGVWDRASDIDFDRLPDQFVLKCTHDSASVIVCRDKKHFDCRAAMKKLDRALRRNFFSATREWPYKNVKPRILAEQYLQDETGELADYKIHNFNGTPRFVLVCRNRFSPSGMTEDFYSPSWEHLPVQREYHKNSATPVECPPEMGAMLELSKTLARGFPFVRTDFYVVDHRIFFGEMTFYPQSGLGLFFPSEWDSTFGSWLTLPTES